MSVREEDRQRNCPSRGLGIAAAAIGVGVGAALYYFFNKRSENPDASGSTTDWTYEEPQALQDSYSEEPRNISDTSMDADSYSEHSYESDFDTTDADEEQSSINAHSLISISATSVSETSAINTSVSETSAINISVDSMSNTSLDTSLDTTLPEYNELNMSNNAGETSYVTVSEYTTTDTSVHDTSDGNVSIISNQSDIEMISPIGMSTAPEGWESIMSQLHLPSPPDPSHLDIVINFFDRIIGSRSGPGSPRPVIRDTAEIQRLAKLREQTFRERAWTLEECSICFDGMQRDQEVMALPCSHRFHQPCILRWLEQRHTCPNCRKEA